MLTVTDGNRLNYHAISVKPESKIDEIRVSEKLDAERVCWELWEVQFVIGRKNWLFSQTATGANASAVLYSIIETAKANDLNVFEYVMTCLDELSKSDADIEQLPPWKLTKCWVGLADAYELITMASTNWSGSRHH